MRHRKRPPVRAMRRITRAVPETISVSERSPVALTGLRRVLEMLCSVRPSGATRPR
jgi:hypothetical protein